MYSFRARRWLGLSCTIGAALLLGLVLLVGQLSLHRTTYFSGWVLLCLVVFLASYNARKKLTYPPLGSSATWLQFHIYGGVLCVVLFLYHTGFRMTSGPFENLLAFLFLGVAISGVLGIFITRTVPKRLTLAGDEVIFERIPMFREQLRQQADQLVVQTVDQSGSSTLAEFYAQRVADHFVGVRNRWSHLAQSSRPLSGLLDQLSNMHRYFDERERQAATEVAELIRLKDRLDYHAVMQGLLKAWLFVHIPLTYAMLVCMVVHVVLVHAFGEVGG